MKKFLLIAFLSGISVTVFAQHPPFYNDIQRFKKQDSLDFPKKKSILFIGSSSFTKWKDVQDYFPSHRIINRGFGGSTLPDLIRYTDDIVFPYKPKQVVIYCGENDIASSDTISAETVAKRFIVLFNKIRSRYRKIPIVYISMKPSPSRERFFPKMTAANNAIQQFLSTKRRTVFVNVYPLMLNGEGQPMKEIFLDDMLHMNSKGYLIWQKALEPYLK
jgi:lysophospholipase L1-like esterase